MTASTDPEREGEPIPSSQQNAAQVWPRRRQAPARLIARVMTFAGWMGLGLSLLFFICMPFLLHRLNTIFSAELNTLSITLRAASNSLAAQEKYVDQLEVLLEDGAGLSAEIDESLTAATPLLDEMAAFLGEQMPLTLNATESSLRSASEGAAAIDALLRIVSRIPFIGSIEYDPSQPLDASLVQAADGLMPLSKPLVELQLDLNEFSLSLKDVQAEISGSEARLVALRARLAGIKDSIRIGSQRLAGLATTLEGVVERLPGLVITLALLLGFSSVWLMLLNVVLILQGRQWSLRINDA
jgi:hypothetical protein